MLQTPYHPPAQENENTTLAIWIYAEKYEKSIPGELLWTLRQPETNENSKSLTEEITKISRSYSDEKLAKAAPDGKRWCSRVFKILKEKTK